MSSKHNVKLPVLPHGASSHLRRNPPKQLHLRQPPPLKLWRSRGYRGYPFRIHPRRSGRGFLRRRVNLGLAPPCVHSRYTSPERRRPPQSACRQHDVPSLPFTRKAEFRIVRDRKSELLSPHRGVLSFLCHGQPGAGDSGRIRAGKESSGRYRWFFPQESSGCNPFQLFQRFLQLIDRLLQSLTKGLQGLRYQARRRRRHRLLLDCNHRRNSRQMPHQGPD